MLASSLLTVDNLLVFGILGAGAAYFTNFQGFKDWVNQQIDDLKGNGGNGPGGVDCQADPTNPQCQNNVDCTAHPDDPSCTGNGNGGGDCASFGGNCNQACLNGCEGTNCVNCLSACNKSCSDTATDESCNATCTQGYCRSWRNKGCTNSCSQCNTSANMFNPMDSQLYTFGDIPISVTTY